MLILRFLIYHNNLNYCIILYIYFFSSNENNWLYSMYKNKFAIVLLSIVLFCLGYKCIKKHGSLLKTVLTETAFLQVQ